MFTTLWSAAEAVNQGNIAMEWKLPPDILGYYQQGTEPTRLNSGPSQLEFARTQDAGWKGRDG